MALHILAIISRSKANQTMKFGQLKEYNTRTIFLEKSFSKCDGETISRPFSKKSKLSISLDQYCKVSYNLFIVCQVKRYQVIVKRSCRPLAFTSYKAFLKNKKRSGTNLPASFSA